MRICLALAALLLLAGCGSESPTKHSPESSNMVAMNPNAPRPRRDAAPPELEPLGSEEIETAGLQGAGCDFTVGEQVLLVAVEREAIARMNGRVVRLIHEGPLGSTGGFFASRELRISVGRSQGIGTMRDEGTSWPARIAVTTPAAGQPSRVEGRWSCGS